MNVKKDGAGPGGEDSDYVKVETKSSRQRDSQRG